MLIRLFICIVLGLSICHHTVHAWTAQSCASRHRLPVIIQADATGHSGEVRIDLIGSDFPAEYNFSTNGDDIRIFESDDTTPIDYVVTAWDAGAQTATLYLRPAPYAGSESRTAYLYFGDSSLPNAENPTGVFPTSGLHLQSRVSTVDPTDPDSALAAFKAASPGPHDGSIPSMSGLTNVALGGTDSDYAWCISAIVEVTPATAGVWSFRYGADFGRGGHLKVAGTMLEEEWNADLWWNFDFNNTDFTLEGSINLPVGFHRYEALGFENCCDGSVGWEAQAPGGAWLDFSPANFPVRTAACANTTVSVAKQPPESCPIALDATTSIAMVVDPGDASSEYAVPGSIVRYTLTVENTGQPVDASTLVLADQVPPDAALIVDGAGAFSFDDGAVGSNLSFNWAGPSSTTDDVDFSTDGVDWSYTPTPGGDANTDPAITHVRFRPQGEFAPSIGANDPGFDIHFSVQLE